MRKVVLRYLKPPYAVLANLEVGLYELAQFVFVRQPVELRCAAAQLLADQRIKFRELLRVVVARRDIPVEIVLFEYVHYL
ncbi:MAG: hypothetical protein IJG13_04490, partial [Kiritimatiellae bacterium]|nr:hypothetical protein [Kiritimatiellia bacterium]